MMNRAKTYFIDYDKVKNLLEEREMNGAELSLKMGRSESWFYGLKSGKARVTAINAIADLLGVNARDIIRADELEEQRPAPVAEQLEIAPQTVAADAIAKALESIAVAIDENTAELKRLRLLFSETGMTETAITEGNVSEAMAVLETMTRDTGECSTKRFTDACIARGITNAEMMKAIDNSFAQIQNRTKQDGTKKSYIVRGC